GQRGADQDRGETSRFRPRQVIHEGPAHHAYGDDADTAHGVGVDSRDVSVHVARADRWWRGRRAERSLGVRLHALRDADRKAGVPGKDTSESYWCHPEGRPAAHLGHHRAQSNDNGPIVHDSWFHDTAW